MSYYIQIGSYQDKKRFDDAVKLFDDAGVKTTAFNSPNNFYSLCIDCPFHDYQQAVNVMKFFQIMRNRFPYYTIMEQEDLNMALHDVDELQSAQQNVIHCKDCKHYRTTGAFGVPLHKDEYFCDADNYPKNDPSKEQRELPEWWFCAGAERKDNKYILDCQTCDIENPSGFKMRDRFTTVPKDVYEKMQMDDLREEQEERLGVAPILNPKT